MKIGVCGGLERAPLIKELGFDYIEENMRKIVDLSDEEFLNKVREYEKLDLPVYAFNTFFGTVSPLYNEDPFDEIKAYGEKAFSRASALGGSICVIGSGKVRAIPDGTPRAFAESRFVDLLSILGNVADKYNIRIAIEPLNKKETNFIHTVGEAADIAKRTKRENIGALVDFYHFFLVNDSLDDLIRVGDSVIHAHIARPSSDRRMPGEEDVPTLVQWAETLRKINYPGTISLEAKYVDFAIDLREKTKYIEMFR